jgi:protein-disulfide isomerase-like protein with CxxC motif
MYDMLYSHQDDLEPGFYGDYAAKIGMNKAHFNAAFAAKQGAQTVSDDMAFDSSIGVQETPTVLLHDNKTGKVTIYVGLTGSNDKKTLGIKSLAADPPWTHPSGIAAAKD